MRITFLIPSPNMSGGIRVLSIYAKRLNKRGHQVRILELPRIRTTFRSKVKSLVMCRGWPKAILEEPSHFDELDIPRFALDSVTPGPESFPDADVILATFWRTGPIVSSLPSSKGAKAILLQGYETSPGYENDEIDAVWRMPLQKIVISKWMVDFARDRFADEEVFLIQNSVDCDLFNAKPRGKQTKPTLGFLYATLHLKGFDVVRGAIERVREKFHDLRVIAFGAESEIASAPLPSGIEFHFRPPQQSLRDLYAECDVWVCGSRREGFHLPPLEAMACRCPVVSTRVGGPIDTVENGVNGFLVDVDDVEGLATQVIKVLSLPEDAWRRMSDAALETATRYSWDDATDLLEAVFVQMNNGRRLDCL